MATWHDVEPRVGYNGFGEIDPYIDWAFGSPPPIKRLFDDGDRFPILLRLKSGLNARQFAEGKIFQGDDAPKDWKSTVRVAQVYLEGGEGHSTYFTALVTARFFKYFDPNFESGAKVAKALRDCIRRMAVSHNLRNKTFEFDQTGGPITLGSRKHVVPTGVPEDGTVVIGIIDDGIAFANARFRTATDLTRVEHIWLQDGDCNAAAARYGYGRSFSKPGSGGIDELLHDSTYGGIVDEEEFYTRIGAIGFGEMSIFRTAALRSSHGTHVMDIACGYPPGAAPNRTGIRGEDNRPIVCVQLPAATNEGTSGASLDTFVVDGIKYILDKAEEIAVCRNCGPLPVVINFSYGTIAGRHDGTSDIERAIDELIYQERRMPAPVQVVIPAGNSRLSRCHARLSFERQASLWKRGSSKTLDWRVLPDDRTTTHLEIWLPRAAHGPKSRIKLSVKPPFGQTSKPLGETFRPVRVWGHTVEEGVCEVRYSHIPEPTNRGMFLVTLKPTVPVENTNTGKMEETIAPAGLWTITLENVSLGPDDVVDAWIQRDDTRYGHLIFGRQSYFDDSKYERFGEDGKVPAVDQPKSAVKRAGTLNAIATGERTIIIGGFLRNSALATDYSGEGRAVSRIGPDALAASDDSSVHSGVLAAGTRSGSAVALTGTSVAAPQITRMVGDLLAEGKPADRNAIRAIAESEEKRTHGHRPPQPCEERGGAGRIERPLTVPVLRVDEPR